MQKIMSEKKITKKELNDKTNAKFHWSFDGVWKNYYILYDMFSQMKIIWKLSTSDGENEWYSPPSKK